MCTAVFFCGMHPRFPVILATNRDEAYARPTRPPEILIDEPRAVGGVDEIGGGTWMAVSAGRRSGRDRAPGYVVGLTNHRRGGHVDPALRSRGELVVEAARRGDAELARAFLRDVDPRHYNPFNFFVADGRGVTLGYGRVDAATVELEEMTPGIHVLPNDRLDAPLAKADRARELASTIDLDAPWPELSTRLGAMLADHHQPAPGATGVPAVPGAPSASTSELARAVAALCIHTPHYGTRSSSVVAIDHGGVAHYLHAEGPPCTAELIDRSALLG